MSSFGVCVQFTEKESQVCVLRTWFPVGDVQIERDDDEEGDQRCPPGDQEHDGDTEQSAQQTHPRVVVLPTKQTQDTINCCTEVAFDIGIVCWITTSPCTWVRFTILVKIYIWVIDDHSFLVTA